MASVIPTHLALDFCTNIEPSSQPFYDVVVQLILSRLQLV
jgi:hypothetical protein